MTENSELYIEINDAPSFRMGRPSSILNEDDFDYALELRPDDEYRAVAELLPSIVEFEDVDVRKLESYKTQDTKDIESQVSHQDQHQISSNEVHSIERSDRNPPLISEKTFAARMGLLQKQKSWVESSRRRSSIAFASRFRLTDKQVHDKFLILLFNGLHVRRHQSFHFSEMIRLSSKDGGRSIMWSRANPRELMAQRKREGIYVDGTTNAVFAATHDTNGFDYCIRFCGCGDDLLTGNKHGRTPITNVLNESDESDYEGRSQFMHNFGFQRYGNFADIDIIAVHLAHREDPTYRGVLGTEALRNSKDVFNAQLTLSVVIRSRYSFQGFVTLDIECENEETYYVLYRGFKLLKEEAQNRQYLQMKKAATDLSGSVGLEMQPTTMNKSDKHSQYKPKDPIEILFEKSNSFDPMRAFIVGGGLLEDSHSSKHSSLSNLVPPAQFLGWSSAGTQIWARLKMAGLDVKCIYSWDLKRIILKLRCPSWRLEEMAEHMHLKLKTRDGTMKRFKVSRRETFIHFGCNGTLFRSSERQQIIDYIIRSKIKDGGAELDEDTELGSHIVQRFPLHMQSRLQEIRHAWVTFWKVPRDNRDNISPKSNSPDTSMFNAKSTTQSMKAAMAAELGINIDLGVDVNLVEPAWSPFSVPLRVTFSRLSGSVENFFSGILRQPLDHVAEYFGESIAFHFAYLAFYTRWLLVPSVCGFIVFCFQIQSQRLDHWLCVPYAILVMIWACFMLAFWRQKSSMLAYRWGVLEYEIEETERPQFKGVCEYDESSGEVRKVYPPWKRVLKYCITLPIITLASIGMLMIMSTVFTTQDKLYLDFTQGSKLDYFPQFSFLFGTFQGSSDFESERQMIPQLGNMTDIQQKPWSMEMAITEMKNSDFWTVTFLYPCIYGVIVDIMAKLFELLAISLNDFENHRTQTVYMNRLILKVFSFQFITVFTSLYYYAFFMANREGAFLRMAVTMFSLMTVGQWWGAFLDVFMPVVYHRIMLYRMKINIYDINRKVYAAKEFVEFGPGSEKGEEIKRRMSEIINRRESYLQDAKCRCWEEAIFMRYTTFSDYTNLIMQLGFVLLFSLVFPLAPLIAFLNNIFLIRFSAYKLCYSRQRPIAQKASSIGVWEDVMQIMSVVGILTNCGVMGYTSQSLSTYLADIGYAGIVVVLFTLEHVMLFFKYWLHTSIPRVPPTVQRAQARERRSIASKRQKKGSNYYAEVNNRYMQSNNDNDNDPSIGNNSLQRDLGSDQHEDPNIEHYNDTGNENTNNSYRRLSIEQHYNDRDNEFESDQDGQIRRANTLEVDQSYNSDFYDNEDADMASNDVSNFFTLSEFEEGSYDDDIEYYVNNTVNHTEQLESMYQSCHEGTQDFGELISDENFQSISNNRKSSIKGVRFSSANEVIEFEKSRESESDDDYDDDDESVQRSFKNCSSRSCDLNNFTQQPIKNLNLNSTVNGSNETFTSASTLTHPSGHQKITGDENTTARSTSPWSFRGLEIGDILLGQKFHPISDSKSIESHTSLSQKPIMNVSPTPAQKKATELTLQPLGAKSLIGGQRGILKKHESHQPQSSRTNRSNPAVATNMKGKHAIGAERDFHSLISKISEIEDMENKNTINSPVNSPRSWSRTQECEKRGQTETMISSADFSARDTVSPRKRIIKPFMNAQEAQIPINRQNSTKSIQLEHTSTKNNMNYLAASNPFEELSSKYANSPKSNLSNSPKPVSPFKKSCDSPVRQHR